MSVADQYESDKHIRRMGKELKACPLRQLVKWAEKRGSRRTVVYDSTASGDVCAVRCSVKTQDGWSLASGGDGPTILKAAADAVAHLKKLGEL